ncbi:hypothetical protein Hdeb2414_s0013g00416171 [Helianthus debilis subsp. tardiflorus]
MEAQAWRWGCRRSHSKRKFNMQDDKNEGMKMYEHIVPFLLPNVRMCLLKKRWMCNKILIRWAPMKKHGITAGMTRPVSLRG